MCIKAVSQPTDRTQMGNEVIKGRIWIKVVKPRVLFRLGETSAVNRSIESCLGLKSAEDSICQTNNQGGNLPAMEKQPLLPNYCDFKNYKSSRPKYGKRNNISLLANIYMSYIYDISVCLFIYISISEQTNKKTPEVFSPVKHSPTLV